MSTDDLLREQVEILIAEGLLIHPDTVKERNRVAATEYRKRCDEAERKESSDMEAKAAECLAPIAEHVGENMKAAMIADIVAAMRWAQSR